MATLDALPLLCCLGLLPEDDVVVAPGNMECFPRSDFCAQRVRYFVACGNVRNFLPNLCVDVVLEKPTSTMSNVDQSYNFFCHGHFFGFGIGVGVPRGVRVQNTLKRFVPRVRRANSRLTAQHIEFCRNVDGRANGAVGNATVATSNAATPAKLWCDFGGGGGFRCYCRRSA